MTKYKLLEMDEMGYFNIHTSNIYLEDTQEMLKRHQNLFPNKIWLIEEENEEDESEEAKQERHYNERAVDGWEDLFNY
jgi:hypothetical protein